MAQDKTTIKINIDLKVPKSWEDLDEKQLRYVFGLIAQGNSEAPQAGNTGKRVFELEA